MKKRFLIAFVIAAVAGTGLHFLYNLLPIQGLDGGRALHLAISWGADPLLADRVCRWVGLLCGGALTAGALVLVARHGTGLFLLLGALGAFVPQLPLAKFRRSR